MKVGIKISLIFSFLLLFAGVKAQDNSLQIDPEIEKMYNPYMGWRHRETGGIPEFKKNHPDEYAKELWYYSKSFYIKRNYFSEGSEMDASIIAIDRFENSRKELEESIVIIPGFKDVLVLFPTNKLIYKP